jgi:hypothetical protein
MGRMPIGFQINENVSQLGTNVTGRFPFAYHIPKVQLKPKDVYFVVLHFCQQSECALVTLYNGLEFSIVLYHSTSSSNHVLYHA